MLLDVSASPITLPHAGYDLVYYERENPLFVISLDWVIVEVGPTASGPWTTVFYWGDNVHDAHTNMPVGYVSDGDGEADNEQIPISILYGSTYPTGIALDLDLLGMTGTHSFVRISSPLGGDNDPAEVDAVEVLP